MESMKKILFSLSLLLSLTLGVQAQHACCSKSAAAKGACEMKVADASTPIPSEYQTAAAKTASLDASIEPRTNPVTGEVTYVRKQTSPHSGEVSFVALNFDPNTSTFVNVSPTQVAAEANNTQGCGATTKTASASKSCCAAGASTKSCCADKTKSASTASSATVAPMKATKTSGGSKD